MQTESLQLNFFPIALPVGPLPFLTRTLTQNEKLCAGELSWSAPAIDHPSQPTKAVLIGTAPADLRSYTTELVHANTASPYVVKLLLQESLAAALERLGRKVVHERVGLLCYRPDEVVSEGVPDLVVMHRGVDIRVDHFTAQGRRLFGFFITTRVRMAFSKQVQRDPRLVRAALQERVTVERDGRFVSAVLVAEGRSATQIRVAVDDQIIDLPRPDIQIPASQSVLSHYCALIGDPEAATRIRRALQVASYRSRRDGQRNRRWISDQLGYVRNWLNSISTYERFALQWPHSDIQYFLRTQPLEVYARGSP